MKLTLIAKKKNHSQAKSKDMLHIDNIIEEYTDLEIINDDILFIHGEVKVNSKFYPVNRHTVNALGISER